MNYSQREFAKASGVERTKLRRLAAAGKLIPEHDDAGKIYYTAEQIPLARQLAGIDDASQPLFDDEPPAQDAPPAVDNETATTEPPPDDEPAPDTPSPAVAAQDVPPETGNLTFAGVLTAARRLIDETTDREALELIRRELLNLADNCAAKIERSDNL